MDPMHGMECKLLSGEKKTMYCVYHVFATVYIVKKINK
jgi:hypothetical protein